MSRNDLPGEKSSNFNARMRETLQTMLGIRGDKLDRVVTLRDLIESDIIKLAPGGVQGGSGAVPLLPGGSVNTPYAQDLTPPPPPNIVSAVTSGVNIQVTVSPQTYKQGNGPGVVSVYGAKYASGDPLPTFADAALLVEFPGDVHAFPVDSAALYRIWVKAVSRDGVPSLPSGGTNGVSPTSGLLDDVAIANLTASRIRSGSVTVGQFIQAAGYQPGESGWRINGDGTAEFSGVVVRGTVYASAGSIGGNIIDSTGVQSTNFATGITGWKLKSNGDIEVNSGTFRGTLDVKSATTNARLEIKNNVIKVFDAAGTLRVQIGDLTA